jgi:hypothetical protein
VPGTPNCLAKRYIIIIVKSSERGKLGKLKGLGMSGLVKLLLGVVLVVSIGAIANEAAARGRAYPLTRCGPDLAYLCPIRGYFDLVPFHYDLAIHPRCIREAPIETTGGIRRRLVIFCG